MGAESPRPVCVHQCLTALPEGSSTYSQASWEKSLQWVLRLLTNWPCLVDLSRQVATHREASLLDVWTTSTGSTFRFWKLTITHSDHVAKTSFSFILCCFMFLHVANNHVLILLLFEACPYKPSASRTASLSHLHLCPGVLASAQVLMVLPLTLIVCCVCLTVMWLRATQTGVILKVMCNCYVSPLNSAAFR